MTAKATHGKLYIYLSECCYLLNTKGKTHSHKEAVECNMTQAITQATMAATKIAVMVVKEAEVTISSAITLEQILRQWSNPERATILLEGLR